MKEKYTVNAFGTKVLLHGSNGTICKWRAKGLIPTFTENDTDYVDIDKCINILLSGKPSHRIAGERALNYFKNGNIHIKNDIPVNSDEFNQQQIVSDTGYKRPLPPPPIHRNDVIMGEHAGISLVDSMIEKNIIDAKLKKLQLNEKVSRLIDRETVLNVFENILIGLKKDLLSIARSKTGLILREKDNPLVAEKILNDAIHEVLEKNCNNNEIH